MPFKPLRFCHVFVMYLSRFSATLLQRICYVFLSCFCRIFCCGFAVYLRCFLVVVSWCFCGMFSAGQERNRLYFPYQINVRFCQVQTLANLSIRSTCQKGFKPLSIRLHGFFRVTFRVPLRVTFGMHTFCTLFTN